MSCGSKLYEDSFSTPLASVANLDGNLTLESPTLSTSPSYVLKGSDGDPLPSVGETCPPACTSTSPMAPRSPTTAALIDMCCSPPVLARGDGEQQLVQQAPFLPILTGPSASTVRDESVPPVLGPGAVIAPPSMPVSNAAIA